MNKLKKILNCFVITLMFFVGIFTVKAEENYDYEKLLNDFIEELKNVELFKQMSDGTNVEITSNGSSVIINVTDKEEKPFTTRFDYHEGILTYVPNIKIESSEQIKNFTEEELSSMLFDNLIALTAAEALVNLKGYDIEEVSKWMEEFEDENALTLENDGFEYKTIQYSEESNEPGASVSIKIEYMTSLKLDLKNGLKSFVLDADQTKDDNLEDTDSSEKTEEIVENPKTGVELKYGVLISLILCSSICYILVRKKSKFAKHN